MIEWPQGFVNFATALSATALNALWQDALLVLCVWLVLRAWPRINAATRYAVWSATLIGAIVIPVATTLAFFTLPKVAHAPSLQAPAQVTYSSARAPAAPSRHHLRVYKTSPVLPAQETLRRPERLQVTLPAWLAIAIFAAWLLLAAYALVRLAIGLVRLEQLKRDALPLAVEYRDEMPQWLRANKGARDVRLCVSDETDVPVAVGLFDAMILIPHSLLDQLSQPEVDQICLHELAHLRRADDGLTAIEPALSRFPRFADLLDGDENEAATERLRRAESIGRPLGSPAFLARLEKRFARPLVAKKRGPKPAAAVRKTRRRRAGRGVKRGSKKSALSP